MRNIDKIKTMKAWELAEFLYEVSNGATKFTTCEDKCLKCDKTDGWCISNIAEWLISE